MSSHKDNHIIFFLMVEGDLEGDAGVDSHIVEVGQAVDPMAI